MGDKAEKFYDNFSRQLLKNYIYGNPRIDRQLDFFREAIPVNARTLLVVGCGYGDSAYQLATKIAPQAEVTAVDLSGNNIRAAKALYNHPRLHFLHADILKEDLKKKFDFILLPDVYEHIPVSSRPLFHEKLKGLLGEKGRILLTLPSPGYQEWLRRSGTGLQVIDETVTLEDLVKLAEDVEGDLTYYCLISVWKTNDYLHAMIEREVETRELKNKEDFLRIKRQKPPLSPRYSSNLICKLLRRNRYFWRKVRLRRKLARARLLELWPEKDEEKDDK